MSLSGAISKKIATDVHEQFLSVFEIKILTKSHTRKIYLCLIYHDCTSAGVNSTGPAQFKVIRDDCGSWIVNAVLWNCSQVNAT